MDDLLKLAEAACREAVKCGAEFADAEVSRGRRVAVKVQKSGIHDVSQRESAGVSVRSVLRGATGFSSCSSLSPREVRKVARQSAEAAKLAQPDPDFKELPGPEKVEEVPGLYDEKVASTGADALIAALCREVDGAREVCPEVKVQGGASLGSSEGVLVNSRGVESRSRRSHIGLSVFCMIRRGDDVGSFYDFDHGHVAEDFSPAGVGAKACREALGFLGSRSVRTGTLPVVFGPLVSHHLLWALAAAASAESIQRKRSYFVDRRGQRLAGELLTIRDDGLIPRGMGSGPRDGEGAPRRRVTVIDHGVLVNHLHGSYTAAKAGEENTGHGSRWGWVGPSNVVPELGSSTAAEIIAGTEEGIYVNMGSAFPHPVTGDISATIDFGYKIEKGKLAYPLRNTMLGISVFDLLKNLDAISSDYRQEPGAIMPTIRVRDVRVAGSA